MRGLVSFILVVILTISCGGESPHSTVSFMTFDHEHYGKHKFLNLLIEHIHDDTWHIPYATAVQRDFAPAITLALQTWLQPLRNLQLGRDIVNDFEYYRYPVNDLTTNEVPWDNVLFRIIFEAGNNGNNVRGEYLGIYVLAEMPSPPPLSADELPILTVFDVASTVDELTADNEFMFTLMHEVGHAFGLADTYTASNNIVSGRKGNQPPSIMASSRELFNYPPTLAPGQRIELSTDDIKGLIWLYKKTHRKER